MIAGRMFINQGYDELLQNRLYESACEKAANSFHQRARIFDPLLCMLV
jgi:hypothetical protein